MFVAVELKSSSAYVPTLSVPALIVPDSRKLAFVLLHDRTHSDGMYNRIYWHQAVSAVVSEAKLTGAMALQMVCPPVNNGEHVGSVTRKYQTACFFFAWRGFCSVEAAAWNVPRHSLQEHVTEEEPHRLNDSHYPSLLLK